MEVKRAMPWYDFVAECCGSEAYTVREIDDRDIPPDADCSCGKIRKGESKWKRVISGKVNMVRGDTWGGSKGNW